MNCSSIWQQSMARCVDETESVFGSRKKGSGVEA